MTQFCNIGYECTTKQVENGFGNDIALINISSDFKKTCYTFGQLEKWSNKMANILQLLHIRRSWSVFIYHPANPVVYPVFIGILKAECVAVPVFYNYGTDAVRERIIESGSKVIISTRNLFRNIEPFFNDFPNLRYVILTDVENDISAKILSLEKLLAISSDDFKLYNTSPEAPSILHYTSGSTGKPKGVLHRHKGINLIKYTSENVLKLKKDEIFWCTADHGWITGSSYGIIGPLSLGVSQVQYSGNFNAEKWLLILEECKVSILYTAPTALRMLMRQENSFYSGYYLNFLKCIYSVGEPLNPEIIYWVREVLKKEVYDTWFQTETGSIIVANKPGQEIKPGSMGKHIDNVVVKVLSDSGIECKVGETGNLCIQKGWDSMFSNYLNYKKLYKKKFKGGWYYSGDMVYQDENEYFWFIGRNDDVIKTAGHLISPFEIESALLEMDEIVESAAIGIPDPILHQAIVVFVSLKDNVKWEERLKLKIKIHLSNRLATFAIPKEIIPMPEIPKNRSGKILRGFLKANYNGDNNGDLDKPII